MLRVVQFLVSSSSSPLHKKLKQQPLPLGLGGLSLLHWNTNTNSSSSSSSSLSRLHSLPSPFMSSPSPGTNRFRSFRLSATPSEESNSRDDAPPNQPLSHIGKASFCQWCGAATKQAIPDDDDKIRAICTVCGKIAYQNPKMVVGCLVEHDNKVLLCRRKIPPSYGLWTLPAGYMEIGESAVDGATRETQEEAGAEVEVLSPFAQIDIPLIGQTYIMFRAKLKSPHFSPGPESLECQLFSLDDIPFDSLAFSSMSVTLNLYIEDLKAGKLKFHYCTISKRPGSGPSDINAFTLDNHWQC